MEMPVRKKNMGVGQWACTEKCSNEVVDFFLLFKHIQEMLEPLELDRWAITARSFWNAQNCYYFKHVQSQPRWIMENE